LNAPAKKRLVLSWIQLAFIVLGLTVFCWGTGYKVSLYYPLQSSVRRIPCAKLLSRDEQQATREQAPEKQAPLQPAPLLIAAAVFGLLSFLSAFASRHFSSAFNSQNRRETGRRWHLHQRIGMSFLFVLPPPAIG
jgi:hypothetical protein